MSASSPLRLGLGVLNWLSSIGPLASGGPGLGRPGRSCPVPGCGRCPERAAGRPPRSRSSTPGRGRPGHQAWPSAPRRRRQPRCALPRTAKRGRRRSRVPGPLVTGLPQGGGRPGPGQPGHLGDLVIVVGGAHPGDRHAGGPGEVLEPVRARPGELAAVGDQQPHPRLRRQHRVPRCGDLAEQRVELVLVLPGQPQPLLVCLPVLGYLLAQRRSREGAVSLFRPVRRGCGGSSRWADRCCRYLDGWPGAAGRRCG